VIGKSRAASRKPTEHDIYLEPEQASTITKNKKPKQSRKDITAAAVAKDVASIKAPSEKVERSSKGDRKDKKVNKKDIKADRKDQDKKSKTNQTDSNSRVGEKERKIK